MLCGLSTILSLAEIKGKEDMHSRTSCASPAVALALTAAFCALAAASSRAQSNQTQEQACCSVKHDGNRKELSPKRTAAAARFDARAEMLLGASPSSKGDWGLLIVDAQTGETLFEKNADGYFVPASNMKLFTTALALAKLGPDYKFHTTLETRGTISPDGKLSGDVVLVGRGDPNLSNRKFPYELKEEFDGPPERALAELADALVARGVKEISGDVVGDDSYFPRERYPNGWEIDDMVWEYGAAISAIVVDDNTVAVTLTPGERSGDPVQASVAPLTPDFTLQNDVATSMSGLKSDLTLTREPGANLVIVRGTLPAKSTPRKLVLAIEEPAQHAASLLAGFLTERGVKIDGKIRAVHVPDSGCNAAHILAEHVSVPLGDSVKARQQNQPELAHGNVTADRRAAKWFVEHARRNAENSAGLLCHRGNCARRRNPNGRLGSFAPRPGYAASNRNVVEVCAGPDMVRAVLCVTASGRHRWLASRTHEGHSRRRKNSCEDRIGRTCQDAFWFCGNAERATADLFVPEQQSGWERSRSCRSVERIVCRDD